METTVPIPAGSLTQEFSRYQFTPHATNSSKPPRSFFRRCLSKASNGISTTIYVPCMAQPRAFAILRKIHPDREAAGAEMAAGHQGRQHPAAVAHDPEKCEAVFGIDHAQTA